MPLYFESQEIVRLTKKIPKPSVWLLRDSGNNLLFFRYKEFEILFICGETIVYHNITVESFRILHKSPRNIRFYFTTKGCAVFQCTFAKRYYG